MGFIIQNLKANNSLKYFGLKTFLYDILLTV